MLRLLFTLVLGGLQGFVFFLVATAYDVEICGLYFAGLTKKNKIFIKLEICNIAFK